MSRMRTIFDLYCQHALVRLGVIVVAFTMVFIRIAAIFSSRVSLWAVEDLLLVWYLGLLTLAFMFGIIIKRQLTSYQAQLLPGSRSIQVAFAFGMWVTVSLIVAWWLDNLPVIHGISLHKAPMVALIIMTFLTTIIVAYFSIRVIFISVYVLALFSFAHVMDIHDVIVRTPYGVLVLLASLIGLAGVFAWRLMSIRESSFEFAYLFAWPMHRSQEGEAWGFDKRAFISQSINPYHHLRGLWKRVYHWRIVDNQGNKALLVFLLLAMGAYEFYILNFSSEDGFYTKPYENFLLLVMVPFFMSLCFNYRILAYSGFTRLLPIKKEDVYFEWGVLLSYSAFASWFLCAIIFAVVPAFLLNLPFIHATKFWIYLLISGVFSQLTLFWFVYVAALKHSPKAIAHCVGYITLVLIIFLTAVLMNTIQTVALLTFALAIGAIFAKKSYQQWCRKEVEY